MIFPGVPYFLIAPQAPLKTERVDLFVFDTLLYFLFSFCLSKDVNTIFYVLTNR